tara:strand:+ start:263 stop:640 length:378 start_codon:yes stop_codon:yes gene_type:complete
MAHFAKVQNGKVIEVLVASQDFIDNYQDNRPGRWVQASYNTRGGVHYDPETGSPSEDQSKALRKNFATIGGLFDVSADAFYLPQPYPSWTLNKTSYLWEPPVERPKDDKLYDWNEETQKWVEVTE